MTMEDHYIELEYTLRVFIDHKYNMISSEPTDMPIIEYITYIRNKYYPDMDISFMKFFMSMYKTKQPVRADLLADYGVLSILPDQRYLDSTHIKRLLNSCNLKEFNGIIGDYIWRTQVGVPKTGKRGGAHTRDICVLTPNAFKICLMNSSNENKYRDYFLFLEECIYHYNNGQVLIMQSKINDLEEMNTLADSEILEKEEHIDTIESEKSVLVTTNNDLIQRLDRMQLQLQQQMQQMQQENQIQLYNMQQETNTQLSTMQATLDKIHKKLPNCVNEPPEHDLNDQFVVMQKESNYYTIRRQKKSMMRVIREKEKEGYNIVYGIYNNEFVPNAIHLWNSTKDVLVKDKLIRFNDKSKNDISLNITKEEFIDIIKNVFESRKTY